MEAVITDINQLDNTKRYNYADYLTWQFQERVELICGWLHRMSPAPLRRHQLFSKNFLVAIDAYLKKRPCQVYSAPFDVRLLDQAKATDNEHIYTVVQPDICVICDPKKLDKRGCLGAPDWIIEIVSRGNTRKELDTKFKLYEENGVLEYWVAQMGDETVAVFDLVDGKYQYRKIYSNDEEIPVGIFPGFQIDLKEIFTED